MSHHGSSKVPITAIVLTKNEEAAIEACLESLSFCDQVIVVDSSSGDATVEIAQKVGAQVVNFIWNGRYPKKKQWGMEHPSVRNHWVLHIDADERVSPGLAREIASKFTSSPQVFGFDIQLEYYFLGKRLRHGHRVVKRALIDRRYSHFPEVGDLDAPGITEVEGHYQPRVAGQVGALEQYLLHHDPDPLSDWLTRHNRYSDWEAYLRHNPTVRSAVRGNRSSKGRAFEKAPFKGLTFFVYCFFLKGGFLDGRAGFAYAYALAFYYWLIGAKTREASGRGQRDIEQRFEDHRPS